MNEHGGSPRCHPPIEHQAILREKGNVQVRLYRRLFRTIVEQNLKEKRIIPVSFFLRVSG